MMRDEIYDNVLDMIGNTPMVRINKVTANDGIKCQVGTKPT